MYVLVLFLPLIIVILPFLLKKVGIKRIINGFFFGVLTTVVVLLFDFVFQLITGLQSNSVVLGAGLISFLVGALPEELFKYLFIRIKGKNNVTNIIVYSLMIAVTFTFIENVLYSSHISSSMAVSRFLQPGHLFFQTVMSMCLVKGVNKNKTKIYGIIGLILALISHQLFNSLNNIEIMKYVFYGIGILTYIYVIIYIIKIKNVNTDETIKFIPLKIIICVVTIVLLVFGFINKEYTMNQKTEIEDGVILTILDYKCEESDFKVFGKYECKMNIAIENTNIYDYKIDLFDWVVFNLKDEEKLSSISFEDDREDFVVYSKEETKLELYFYVDTDDFYNLSYKSTDSSNSTFKLK